MNNVGILSRTNVFFGLFSSSSNIEKMEGTWVLLR